MRIVEAGIFLVLAGALHAAAFVVGVPGGGVPEFGGTKGQSEVTLTAVPDHVIDQWLTAPDTQQTTAKLQGVSGDDAPRRPLPENRPLPIAPPKAQPLAPAQDTAVAALLPPEPRGILPNAPAMAPPVQPGDDAPRSDASQTTPVALPMRPGSLTTPNAPDLFQPPQNGFAPMASLRPNLRPKDLAPQPPAPQPRAKAQTQRAPQPAAKAKGTGKAKTASQAKPAAKPKPKAAAAGNLRTAQANWGAKIKSAVARAQRYPSGTRASGTVTLILSVSPAGRLVGVSVAKSSGDATLDKAAIRAVRKARIPRAPKALTNGSYNFRLPLRFVRS